MRYSEAIDFLMSQLPMFQRIGAAAYRADLSNTLALCELCEHPERGFKSIHVAGTNGKGSVSHLIASAVQESGYKTGLFTSPHLKDFRERIRINGEMIHPEAVTEFVSRYKKLWEAQGIQPSFFEISALMAFDYFREEGVDVAVIETGMGGRLDSTNVITPELSVITNVSLDHVKFLGETVELIAREKAGIIKPGVPVVLGEMDEHAREVCIQRAVEMESDWRSAADLVLPVPPSPLLGQHQLQNARTAYTALESLRNKAWAIPLSAIQRGFERVRENTGLRGRWEMLSERPLTIADVAHNEDGMRMVMQELARVPRAHLHIVLGMSDDKDASAILRLLPTEASYYFCRPNVPRGRDAELLQSEAAVFGLKGEVYASVAKAYAAARIYATQEDVIFIGGSFFVVAELI